jgi:hypothetical protein
MTMNKNITLSADVELIHKARGKALGEKKTLNLLFREWLRNYTSRGDSGKTLDEVLARISYARPGRHFTREEMNAR